MTDMTLPAPRTPNIVTSHDAPPIPWRSFDWSAWDDSLGADCSPIGRGATEAEAIADFKQLWEEEYGTPYPDPVVSDPWGCWHEGPLTHTEVVPAAPAVQPVSNQGA